MSVQQQLEQNQKIYLRNSIRREEGSAKGRWSDAGYYYTNMTSKLESQKNPNPEFTQEDLKKKLEILDVKDMKECFVTGKQSKGVGDHLYEVNGYHRYTGKRGINDKWNLLPVTGEKNKKYKKFHFMMDNKIVKKDIGYQDLTEEELLYLISSENEEEIKMAEVYLKVNQWKSYVKSRGASLCFEETEIHKIMRQEFKNDYKLFWDTQIEKLISQYC